MTTATIFGSFANSAVAQPAAAPAPAASVAAMFDSFARDGAPMDAPNSGPTDNGKAVTASIFGSYSNHLAVVPAGEPSAVTSAVSGFVARIRQALDGWMASNAQSRADAQLWDIARSDPRTMGELMQAQMRDDSETWGQPVAALAMPAAPALEEAPMVRQPRQRTAGQGWGRIIEDAYQNRFHQPRHHLA